MEFGLKHGMLTYVDDAEPRRADCGRIYKMINCSCDCGGNRVVDRSNFIKGYAFSCGCTRKYKNVLHKTHNHYGTPEYNSWYSMKDRCDSPNNTSYSDYGGRGITYPDKWATFSGFWEDMSSTHVAGLSIDRIDPNLSYSKENCRWACRSVQSYNRRKNTNNKSGKTGVQWTKHSNKWTANFNIEGKMVRLGSYEFLWDAIFIRMQKEQEIYGYVKE